MTTLDQTYQDFLNNFDTAMKAPKMIEVTSQKENIPELDPADFLFPVRELTKRLSEQGQLTADQAKEITDAAAQIETILASVDKLDF